MSTPKRVLVVGLGSMGMSHARAYTRIDGFEVVGICERSIARREVPAELASAERFASFEDALRATRPDVVSINTFADTHSEYAIRAMKAGAHVFVEKPLAETVEAAQAAVDCARRTGRKLVVGYILRHHPSWIRLVALAKTLGAPLVFRMNLNQQSSGSAWEAHKRLLQSLSPIVDCGVHYLDVMCQITPARPTHVHAMGVRLTDDMPAGMYNFGHLQVGFADGSIGWYEFGWGPMISETAYFVKDVIGPKGSVSIVMAETAGAELRSSDINAHTKTNRILLHHAELGPDGNLARADELIDTADEPDHEGLCEREQRFLMRAIDEDLDLSDHMDDAVKSLAVALAADQSVRTGEIVRL